MSTQIIVASGWCLTAEQFAEHAIYDRSKTDDASEAYNEVSRRLNGFKTVVAPEATVFSLDKEQGMVVANADLLNGDDEFELPKRKRLHSAAGLMEAIHDREDMRHVMFFIDALDKNEHYRYNSLLDWMLAEHPLEADGNESVNINMNAIAKPLKFNPYPYANELMHKDTGKYYEWQMFSRLNKLDNWAPRPPRMLRWWLKETNILTDEGILALRPYLCRWFV